MEQGDGCALAAPECLQIQCVKVTVPDPHHMSQSIVAELAPHGVLRAGINMSNFLLVTGRTPSGDPDGVSPDMARAIADRLGVPVKYVPFAKPGELADAVGDDVWDIGLIGAEPARAEKIAFTAAYVEIEATYLVPAGSPLKTIADVDKPGVRIAVSARSAYDLWLERNIKHATLIRSGSLDAAMDQFVAEKLEALAGLRPRLLTDVTKLPGAVILPGQFTAVRCQLGGLFRQQCAIALDREGWKCVNTLDRNVSLLHSFSK